MIDQRQELQLEPHKNNGKIAKNNKYQNIAEIYGVKANGLTKPDTTVGETTRNFLESPDPNHTTKKPRIIQLLESLFDDAIYGKGYLKIRSREVLLERGYGRPVEHLQLGKDGTIENLTININGTSKNDIENNSQPAVITIIDEKTEQENSNIQEIPENIS